MTTPIDRESVERLAHIFYRTPLYHGHGEESDLPEEARDTLLALRAALDAAEAEKQLAVAAALREAADIVRGYENFREWSAWASMYAEILALIDADAGAALDRALAAERERDAKVAEAHPMRFAGQTEDDVRAALAAAIRAQGET